jgi:hypothetical protein
MIFKLRKYFALGVFFGITLFFGLSIMLSYDEMDTIIRDYNREIEDRINIPGSEFDESQVMLYFFVMNGIFYLIFCITSFCYIVMLNQFNKSMINFHVFLNNYR